VLPPRCVTGPSRMLRRPARPQPRGAPGVGQCSAEPWTFPIGGDRRGLARGDPRRPADSAAASGRPPRATAGRDDVPYAAIDSRFPIQPSRRPVSPGRPSRRSYQRHHRVSPAPRLGLTAMRTDPFNPGRCSPRPGGTRVPKMIGRDRRWARVGADQGVVAGQLVRQAAAGRGSASREPADRALRRDRRHARGVIAGPVRPLISGGARTQGAGRGPVPVLLADQRPG
jgi:hypothetical protein